jgi:hypothetical protein
MLVNMKKEINNNSCECPSTTNEIPFVGIKDQAGRYELIQLTVNPKDVRKLKLSQDYLLVNNNWSGVYQLENILYPDGKIQLRLKSNTSFNVVSTLLADHRQPFYLLYWNDIKQMVFEDNARRVINDELLELVY